MTLAHPDSDGCHPAIVEALQAAFADLPADGASTRRQVLAALIGRGITASLTPGMHEAEGTRLGLRYVYRLLDFDRLGFTNDALPAVITAAHSFGLDGLNVTHPFKQAALHHVETLSPNAAAIGAINTIVFSNGRVSGHNTDAYGFAQSFRQGLPDAPLGDVVLVGAGGAGLAVAHVLLGFGLRALHIVDRLADKARSLAADLARRFPGRNITAESDVAAALTAADGVINATPSGMEKYPGSPFDTALLRPDLWVADIVYFPAETDLLRAARAAGCRTLGGSGMALFQAVRAFGLITGLEADPRHMARHLAELGEMTPGGARNGAARSPDLRAAATATVEGFR